MESFKERNVCVREYKFRYVLIGVIALLLSVFLMSETTFAQSNNVESDNYAQACEAALTAIQPMNKEKLDVCIGDIYNVIDVDGNLDGYSLGYYVGDNPYGYAIYDTELASVREFVFAPDVSNLYNTLEDKAEEVDNVDEDNLVDCVVYEGGIDYCRIDDKGNKVLYENGNAKKSVKKDVVDSVRKRALHLKNKQIKWKKSKNKKTEGEIFTSTKNGALYSESGTLYSTYKKTGYEMCTSTDYWDVASKSAVSEFCIVPDAGLAMTTQGMIRNNKRIYGCGFVSAVGIINWMGRCNGSIMNTYDNLLDYMKKKGKVDIDNEEQVQIATAGVTMDNMAKCLNNYYFSSVSKSNVRAKMDEDDNVTFNELRNHVGGVYNGERSPCMLGIWIEEETGNLFPHGVTVLSTIKTSSNDKYVGIWNGWDFDPDVKVNPDGTRADTHSIRSAYQSVRYINWKDLNKSNVTIDAMYFKNVRSSNIKEPVVTYASGNSIEVECYVPSGTEHVYFPTWSVANGQDDIIWHEGTVNNNYATIKIDLSKHNLQSGLYAVHIYAKKGDTILASGAIEGGGMINIDKTIKLTRITKNSSGYSISCTLPMGTAYVRFPTWSMANGQDDIIWYNGNIDSGSTTFNLNIANHNSEKGLYATHIYAYDKYDKMITCRPTNVEVE